jgi:hypothetical protein
MRYVNYELLSQCFVVFAVEWQNKANKETNPIFGLPGSHSKPDTNVLVPRV